MCDQGIAWIGQCLQALQALNNLNIIKLTYSYFLSTPCVDSISGTDSHQGKGDTLDQSALAPPTSKQNLKAILWIWLR